MSHLIFVVISTVLLALANHAQAATVASSDFSSGADGWDWNAPNPSMSWQADGGNPGGYIRYDNNQGGDFAIHAPSSYLGDWGTLEINELTYQVNIFTTGSVARIGNLQATISGPGGEARWLGPQPDPSTPWKDISVPISDTSWTVDSGTWEDITSNVTDLTIFMAYYTNTGPFEITGIDNVALNAVPIPAALPLFVSAIALIGFLGKKSKRA